MMRSGEVWLINLDPTIGAEIKKTRPVVIVSRDLTTALRLKVVVPLTQWKARYEQVPWMVRIDPNPQNGLAKPSSADAFQVRAVDESRFVRQLGRVSEQNMKAIGEALLVALEI